MAKKKSNRTAEADKQYMYVGPAVPSVGLITNKVYIGDITSHFEVAKEKFPLVMQLVAPLDKIRDVQAAMARKGTPAYMAVTQIKNGVK